MTPVPFVFHINQSLHSAIRDPAAVTATRQILAAATLHTNSGISHYVPVSTQKLAETFRGPKFWGFVVGSCSSCSRGKQRRMSTPLQADGLTMRNDTFRPPMKRLNAPTQQNANNTPLRPPMNQHGLISPSLPQPNLTSMMQMSQNNFPSRQPTFNPLNGSLFMPNVPMRPPVDLPQGFTNGPTNSSFPKPRDNFRNNSSSSTLPPKPSRAPPTPPTPGRSHFAGGALHAPQLNPQRTAFSYGWNSPTHFPRAQLTNTLPRFAQTTTSRRLGSAACCARGFGLRRQVRVKCVQLTCRVRGVVAAASRFRWSSCLAVRLLLEEVQILEKKLRGGPNTSEDLSSQVPSSKCVRASTFVCVLCAPGNTRVITLPWRVDCLAGATHQLSEEAAV